LCFFLIFARVIIFFSNGLSLLLLLFALLGIIALVFDVIGVLAIVGPFGVSPVVSPARAAQKLVTGLKKCRI
jgi:hypothetical protein